MVITGVQLLNFRNYQALKIGDIDQNFNILYGDNAQGKTNLIEAIYFLSTGKSFRDYSDARLIRYGSDKAYLRIDYDTGTLNGKLEAILYGEGKKSIKVNGIAIKRLSELLGNAVTVLFSPEDLKTIKESPGLRRRFMDMELSKINPSYYVSLQNYLIVLKNRNKLLKLKSQDTTLFSVYHEKMAAEADRRARFLEMLNRYAGEIHSNLTENEEILEIRYKCSADPDAARDSLYEKWEKSLKREMEAGTTLYGPHREDIEITINGKDTKIFSSQGQQRTAMLSMKLAVVRIVRESIGQTPILLLDDVFSELDKKRRKMLVDTIKDVQVFITTTHDLLNSTQGCHYKIMSGSAKRTL